MFINGGREKKENKLLILVSLFGHILDDKVTSLKKNEDTYIPALKERQN